MRHINWNHALGALAFALLLFVRPAGAITQEEACTRFVELTEAAMDLRLAGVPAQRVVRELRESGLDDDRVRLASRVVGEVYALPKTALVGATRADGLTELYTACIALGEGV